MTAWAVERVRGSAVTFHGRDLPDPLRRTVWAFEIDRPALVLGSAQRAEHLDLAVAARRGVEVVRRRSGGGAVLLGPGDVWVDLLLPRSDPLWVEDVGKATHWVGQAWAEVLADLGLGAVTHTGPMVRTPLSATVCFAGLGPGEVCSGGRKVVGLSQRRVRRGARFQTVAPARWDLASLAALLDLLGLPLAAAGALVGVAAGLGDLLGESPPPSAVVDLLITHLPVA